jgi:GT2 family glycosyltransferase
MKKDTKNQSRSENLKNTTILQREDKLRIIRISLQQKIPSFFYKFYIKNIQKHIPQPIFRTIDFFIAMPKNCSAYFEAKKLSRLDDYARWIKKNENWNIEKITEEIKNFKYNPKISIITPVYNIDAKWLDKCIKSVKNQFYENWELCLHDDASTKKETIRCLKKWKKVKDKRIKISFGKINQHISGASNEALKLATGEFVALLDNDDELSPNALYENVKTLNENPQIDFIYSDEDKIDIREKRSTPFFKPDWSPDLFLSMMYTCHLGVYRKKIIDQIGSFRKGYEGSQDYDLVLRFIEKTKPKNIFHIPKILYHWRTIAGSTSDDLNSKSYAHIAAKKSLVDYLKRNEIEGEILDGKLQSRYRIKRKIKNNPKISIIIPFKDKTDILKKCVDSIFEKTDYKNFEIILVDNQSKDIEMKNYLKTLENNPLVKIIHYNKPFNYSAINNYAVKKISSEYVLFLNNDTEIISKEWLGCMVEHIQRADVGAVGAKLLYPDNTVQHAGVIMGIGWIAGHAFKLMPSNSTIYFTQLQVIKNYSAVTGACLLTKKRIFEEIGGFDENNLAIAYNDVNLCLNIREKGYLIIYTPYAELYHYESLSRESDEDSKFTNPERYKKFIAECDYMRNHWLKYIENDPYYNPNLTKTGENFEINN